MDDFARNLAKALSDYTTEIVDGLEDVKKDVATKAVADSKRTSPKSTGDYAKGWRKKKTQWGWVIYNETDYQLTHLLEKGHAKRGGGRVAAKPHIAKVEEKYIDEFEKRAIQVIQK
ncbi:hypothetical protein SAMN04515656_1129 [Eubacterium aggregans]|uniref:Uncharacterized protein n=1 Tax=Eubacterium aggregans TaxID=81409 RepID=A0A1H4BN08_9FIRM|nr:hypothetical protein [Eubacterium aggregans]SEA49543.1 hypothetical protein SAMN04515656_1129 [Eubacterium aggregans]